MTIQQKEQTTFKDLTWVCKVGIIGGWVTVLLYAFAFVIGFATVIS